MPSPRSRAAQNPSANLGLVEEYTRRAADAGAGLVLFPEATMCRFGVPLAPIAEPLDGSWASAVRAIAERAGIVVVAGMFVPADDGRVTNTLIATGPGVDTALRQDLSLRRVRIHRVETVAPGHEPVDITRRRRSAVGLTLCYDIRFPELYVELARRGAQLITVHASWGTGPGKLEQWTLLARARAIDTTGFVAAVDQAYPGAEMAAVGPTGVGGSLVASAVGEVLASAGSDPQLLITDIDLATAQKARETIAVMSNRTYLGKAESLR